MLSLHMFLKVPLRNRHRSSEKSDIGWQSPHPSSDKPPLQPNISSSDKAKAKNTEGAPGLHCQNCRIKLQQFPKTPQCLGGAEVPTVDDTAPHA